MEARAGGQDSAQALKEQGPKLARLLRPTLCCVWRDTAGWPAPDAAHVCQLSKPPVMGGCHSTGQSWLRGRGTNCGNRVSEFQSPQELGEKNSPC